MKNNKGSHIGVIASFSIFILFLVGLYLISEPIVNTKKDKELMADYADFKLVQNFSGNLTTAIIKPTDSNEVVIENSFVDVENGLDALVKDKNNNLLKVKVNPADIVIEGSSEDVLWVYYADVNFTDYTFTPSGGGVGPAVSSIKLSKEIFEEKIIDGFENFAGLKQNLGLPEGTGFSLYFKMANGTVIEEGAQNVSGDVFTKEVPITYYNRNAERLNGILGISVW